MSIEDLYNEHKKLNFPDFPEDDSFSEWVEELIEVDAYYIGLLVSFINNERITIDNSKLEKLIYDFYVFMDLDRDLDIVKQCKEYLNSLKELVDSVRKKL